MNKTCYFVHNNHNHGCCGDGGGGYYSVESKITGMMSPDFFLRQPWTLAGFEHLIEKIKKFNFKNQSCIRWNGSHTLIAISQTRRYDENTLFSLFH